MATSSTERLAELRMNLLEVERQQNDYTLPHSDQQLLDQAWEDLTNQIEELEHLAELRANLLEVERQQTDPTLPHSDQQLLDQAWEDLTNQIEELEQSLLTWRDATQYLEEEEELVTIARGPPTDPNEQWVPGPEVLRIAVPPSIEEEDEEEEEQDDCRYCSGCYYCRDSPGYDGADEI